MSSTSPSVATANRWLIVLSGVIMQLALGSVYAWSIYTKSLIKDNHWSVTQATLPFTISIAFIGIGAIIGGMWQDRVGPRLVALVGGILYSIGVILASFSIHNLTMLVISYGILGGTGIGLAYITPVAMLVKWFPDRRGLVTGLAVAGFGGGAVAVSLLGPSLITNSGVNGALLAFGIAYLILTILAALYFQNPPAGWSPPGWTAAPNVASQRATRDFTQAQALTRPQWYALWAMLTLNVTAGIMLISQAAPLATSKGQAVEAAAGFVALVSVFNATGRFFWSWLSDLIGRRQVFMTMFGIQAVIFAVLTFAGKGLGFGPFAALMLIVALCYGGGFGTMPAFTADYFGAKYAGAIYGTMLTAWSVGGILGPILIAQVKDRTGGYTLAFGVITVVMLASLLLPIFTRAPRAADEAPQAATARAQAGPAS